MFWVAVNTPLQVFCGLGAALKPPLLRNAEVGVPFRAVQLDASQDAVLFSDGQPLDQFLFRYAVMSGQALQRKMGIRANPAIEEVRIVFQRFLSLMGGIARSVIAQGFDVSCPCVKRPLALFAVLLPLIDCPQSPSGVIQ